MEDKENETTPQQNTEVLRLIRNSKGYNWEIKILEIDMKRLDELNEQMKTKYGGKIL